MKKKRPLKNYPALKSAYFKDVIKTNNSDTTSSYIVIGDWGKQGEALESVSLQMGHVAEYLNIDFVLTLGDNIYESGVDSINDPYWEVYTDNFNQVSLQVPWYISLGNHDYNGNVQAQVDYSDVDSRWTLPSFFYQFNTPLNESGDSLGFVVIDTYRLRQDPTALNQNLWIDSVAASLATPWKIMFGHHPLYSYGYHGSDTDLQFLLGDVLEDNDFDLYLAGHDHDMQHIQVTGNTDFFISGSAAKIRDTDTGAYSLFSLSEYGFLTIRMSKHIMECYFIDLNGDVVYKYKKIK